MYAPTHPMRVSLETAVSSKINITIQDYTRERSKIILEASLRFHSRSHNIDTWVDPTVGLEGLQPLLDLH